MHRWRGDIPPSPSLPSMLMQSPKSHNLLPIHSNRIRLRREDVMISLSCGRDEMGQRHLLVLAEQLRGDIPPELGNLTNLLGLELSFNELTGPIPSELGNLINLLTLSSYSNELTGSIPSALGNLVNLSYLSLGSNQLTGSIPIELGNLINLNR